MRRTILTAAHCFDFDNYCKKLIDLRLVIGAMDLAKADDDGMYNVKISKIEIHSNYKKTEAYDYDFAIISLDCDLEYDHGVAPVCLGQTHNPSLYENRDTVAVGWGMTECVNNNPTKLQVMLSISLVFLVF